MAADKSLLPKSDLYSQSWSPRTLINAITIDEGLMMETVNALKIRNKPGEILDRLDASGEPIPLSKGRKLRALNSSHGLDVTKKNEAFQPWVDSSATECRASQAAILRFVGS